MKPNKRPCFLILTALLITAKVQAEVEAETYESIVSQLAVSTVRKPKRETKPDFLSTATIHGGVALTNSFATVRTAGSQRVHAQFGGVQASLGIDLFSPSWIAEGTARSYTDHNAASARLRLQEFDLKLVHRAPLYDHLTYRLGAGLAARYLSVSETLPESGVTEVQYSTPASILSAGVDFNLSDKVSLGTEASYRSTLVADTIDRLAYDVVIRMDAHF